MTPERLVGSVQRGVRFLLNARSPEGWWSDFETLAGESDEWVTAYAAWTLAEDGLNREAAACAMRNLMLRERSQGWGYRSDVPADNDTTAWVCRLMGRLGMEDQPAYERGRRRIVSAIRPDGGVPAYSAAGQIRRFTRVPLDVSFAGWTSSHVCVTANAAAVVGGESLSAYVAEHRQADG